MSADWALVSANVATPDGPRPAAVLVRGEKVAAVVAPDEVPAGCRVEDMGGRLVLPGLVDLHVHVNEPGRTDWEGFETATRAAAAKISSSRANGRRAAICSAQRRAPPQRRNSSQAFASDQELMRSRFTAIPSSPRRVRDSS